MGSDENYFNVSLIVRDKITRQCLQTTTFLAVFAEMRKPVVSSAHFLSFDCVFLCFVVVVEVGAEVCGGGGDIFATYYH